MEFNKYIWTINILPAPVYYIASLIGGRNREQSHSEEIVNRWPLLAYSSSFVSISRMHRLSFRKVSSNSGPLTQLAHERFSMEDTYAGRRINKEPRAQGK